MTLTPEGLSLRPADWPTVLPATRPGASPTRHARGDVTAARSIEFLVSNSIGRYALSQRDTFVTNADGSVDLYLQAESPGPDKEPNWLPAPKGKFVPMLRLYWPQDVPPTILNRSWTPPRCDGDDHEPGRQAGDPRVWSRRVGR